MPATRTRPKRSTPARSCFPRGFMPHLCRRKSGKGLWMWERVNGKFVLCCAKTQCCSEACRNNLPSLMSTWNSACSMGASHGSFACCVAHGRRFFFCCWHRMAVVTVLQLCVGELSVHLRRSSFCVGVSWTPWVRLFDRVGSPSNSLMVLSGSWPCSVRVSHSPLPQLSSTTRSKSGSTRTSSWCTDALSPRRQRALVRGGARTKPLLGQNSGTLTRLVCTTGSVAPRRVVLHPSNPVHGCCPDQHGHHLPVHTRRRHGTKSPVSHPSAVTSRGCVGIHGFRALSHHDEDGAAGWYPRHSAASD